MTIKDCANCGGTHYGSIKCPHDGPPNANPDDECYCGDRRDQHDAKTGACRLNGLGHGMGGPLAGECNKFRFSRYAKATAQSPGNGAEVGE
jgi:hypothetical protein